MLFPTMLIAFAVAGPQAAAVEPITLDAQMRPMIAVSIDGNPPVDMLMDTAAQSSVLTTALAEMLGLPPTDEPVTVNGVAGSMTARAHGVRRMTSALFDVRDTAVVALPRIGITRARGILGIDLFAGRKLVFDLAGRRLSVDASGPAAADHVAVRGSIDAKGLLHVPVTIDGVVIDALVDTGAEGSVANGAALRALGWHDDDPRLKADGTITGATIGGTIVRRGTVGRVALGPVGFRGVPLTFTGSIDGAPRLILGMDMLGLLQRFALDLPRAELQLYIPPAATPPAPPPPPARTGS